MRAVVVGFGSIGSRHARLLSELGCRTAVVSARAVDFPESFPDLESAIDAGHIDYFVIANATADHHATLSRIAASGHAGKVLIEKPLFQHSLPVPEARFSFAGVAYNLRFHPVLRRMKERLEGRQLLSLQIYAGQYLPTWRPGTDYRDSYSASVAAGGGALLDLSHELDYLLWFAGPCEDVAALGGHFSPLEIDSDDIHALLCRTQRCPVATVQVNYLDRQPRRSIIANTTEHTVVADLVAGTVTVDDEVETLRCERDDTYRDMHRAILDGRVESVCSLDEGLQTLRLVDAARKSVHSRAWVQP